MYDAEMQDLLSSPHVREAFDYIEASDEQTSGDQAELTRIAASPYGEKRRAEDFARRIRASGIEARVDEEGNVVARRPGTGDGPVVALTAHLDTVFPPETDVRVESRGDVLAGPGISDNGRGLAAVLAVLRALERTDIATRADILFVGTVGEEGPGDLRGVKHLFRDSGPRIDAFISVDGADVGRITHEALGSSRYRVVFRGPGGHSWAAFGVVNPSHALARTVLNLEAAGERLVSRPDASYNVGRIGGGTSVNSIPSSAWMEVDLRARRDETLEILDAALHEAVERAREDTLEGRRGGGTVEVEVVRIGSRPSGEISADTPLVQRAVAAGRALGIESKLTRSSTDANVPIALGIPSITLGGGGRSGRAHSEEEWYDNAGGVLGIQRLLLIVLAQAGMAS